MLHVTLSAVIVLWAALKTIIYPVALQLLPVPVTLLIKIYLEAHLLIKPVSCLPLPLLQSSLLWQLLPLFPIGRLLLLLSLQLPMLLFLLLTLDLDLDPYNFL